MKLSERQRAFLAALAQAEHPLGPGAVFRLAFPDAPHRGRRDAGATRTLDSLQREGLVVGRYLSLYSGRDWTITAAGREAIG